MILYLRPSDNLLEAVEPAAAVIRSGGIVALPTETVYGLACDALNGTAVVRLRRLKGRPADHPLPVQLADAAALSQVAHPLPTWAEPLARRFWPGPLTLVLPCTAKVPAVVTGGRDTVGVRVPDHPVAQALLRAVGRPLAVPSANRTGEPPLPSAAAIVACFGGEVPVVLAGDDPPGERQLPSTVVDVTRRPPVILRQGAVPAAEILETCQTRSEN